MPVFRTICEVFSVKEWRDLETIVSIALCCTIFELFDVE